MMMNMFWNKYMIIESAWGQLLFFPNRLGGGTIKFQSNLRVILIFVFLVFFFYYFNKVSKSCIKIW